MLFFKRSVKAFEIVNTQSHQDKIDSILRAVLPPDMLKKKQTTKDD
jgi:hypothetical protein